MSLKSYEGAEEVLKALPPEIIPLKPFAEAFYRGFREEVQRELVRERDGRTRSQGDRQALSDCIKAGMKEAGKVLTEKHPQIQRDIEYGIKIVGLPRLKKADYAFRCQDFRYVIEQKSNLRFNEFAEAALEGALAKQQDGEKIRFVGLFNGWHQNPEAFEKLTLDGSVLLDRMFILGRDRSGEWKYSTGVIEDLFSDIVEFLQPKQRAMPDSELS